MPQGNSARRAGIRGRRGARRMPGHGYADSGRAGTGRAGSHRHRCPMTGVAAEPAAGRDPVAAGAACPALRGHAHAGARPAVLPVLHYVQRPCPGGNARGLRRGRHSAAAPGAGLAWRERSVFASPKVTGLYELLFAESWPVEVNPGRFRTDETRRQVLGRTAGILGDLEAAIRREVGGGQIPTRTGH